jgi:hypothetical protein
MYGIWNDGATIIGTAVSGISPGAGVSGLGIYNSTNGLITADTIYGEAGDLGYGVAHETGTLTGAVEGVAGISGYGIYSQDAIVGPATGTAGDGGWGVYLDAATASVTGDVVGTAGDDGIAVTVPAGATITGDVTGIAGNRTTSPDTAAVDCDGAIVAESLSAQIGSGGGVALILGTAAAVSHPTAANYPAVTLKAGRGSRVLRIEHGTVKFDAVAAHFIMMAEDY